MTTTTDFSAWAAPLCDAPLRSGAAAGSALEGSGAPSALQADGEVHRALADASRESAARDALAASPSTGLAVLLNLVRHATGSAGVDPSASPLAAVQKRARSLAECPILLTAENKAYQSTFAGPWGRIDGVIRMHDGVGADSLERLRSVLRSMIKAFKTRGKVQHTCFYAQRTLWVESDTRAVLCGSKITLLPQRHGPESFHVELHRANFVLDTRRWPDAIDSIARRFWCSIQSWLQENEV